MSTKFINISGVTQLQQEKRSIEERERAAVDRLSQRITELESENATLESQNQSLQKDLQLLQGQLTDFSNAAEPMTREYHLLKECLANCQEERQILQEQFTKCQKEKQQLLTAQQQSETFGIDPWRVPYNKVKL